MHANPSLDPRDALLRHRTFVRALSLRLVRDPHEADDVAQETLLVALDRRPADPARLRPWLARVAGRVAFTRRRARARRDHRERAAARPESVEPEPTRALELRQRVVDAVLALPAAQREAVVLRYDRGLSVPDVAARQGVPLETARTRLKRALATLRARLAEAEGPEWRAGLALLLPGADRAALGLGGVSTAGAAPPAAKVAAAAVAVATLGGAAHLATRAPDEGLPDRTVAGRASGPAAPATAAGDEEVRLAAADGDDGEAAAAARHEVTPGDQARAAGDRTSWDESRARDDDAWERAVARAGAGAVRFRIEDYVPPGDLALLRRLRTSDVVGLHVTVDDELHEALEKLAVLAAFEAVIDPDIAIEADMLAHEDLVLRHPMPTAQALDHVLVRYGDLVSWCVRDGRVLVTHADDTAREPIAFEHPVGDLFPRDEEDEPLTIRTEHWETWVPFEVDDLQVLVRESIAPGTWSGPDVGAWSPDDVHLAVQHAPEVHAEVQDLLDRLRGFGAPPADGPRGALRVWPPEDPREEALRARLDEVVLTRGFGDGVVPGHATELAAAVADALGADVVVSHRVLEDLAREEASVHLPPAARTAREVLDALDAATDVGWCVDGVALRLEHDVLLDGVAQTLVVHDVGALLQRMRRAEGGLPFDPSAYVTVPPGETFLLEGTSDLVTLVHEGIAAPTWDEDPSNTLRCDTYGLLWVRQHPVVQRRIEGLLDALRAVPLPPE